MKFTLALLVLFPSLLLANPVDYSFSLTNAEGLGNLSWTVESPAFITADYIGTYWITGPAGIMPTGAYINLLHFSESDGCGVKGILFTQSLEFTTYFAPLCNGLYDSETSSISVPANTFGTWDWSGHNPDGSVVQAELVVSDQPASMPEPGSALLLGLGFLFLRCRRGSLGGQRGNEKSLKLAL